MTQFAMTNRFVTQPGEGARLVEILLGSTEDGGLDGCLLYLVATDAADPDVVIVTELWRDEAAHAASLQDPDVRAAIGAAMPIIRDMRPTKLVPAGGVGVPEDEHPLD